MNIFVCTAQIVSQPALCKVENVNSSYMIIAVQNFRTTATPLIVKAFAKGKIAKKILQEYSLGSYVIVQSSIYVKKTLNSSKNSDKKKLKSVFIKINDIFNL
uniref:Uncharacterized protein n=1 Tax=Melanthalia intermedia TaxID=172989 RepID=A0A345UAP7_9FLOR|nr:hypothetical protein [Melanthalia intermedia]AXI97533.1 hypothetical protein [Melanthalia intermedia]